ncbi:hypothetical protein D3C75_729100 [compost metagenome]
MVSRDAAGGDAPSGLCDINSGLKVMPDGEKFLNRIDNRHVVAARFEQFSHDRDREFFSTADHCGVDAVWTLPQQADAVQDML